MDDVLKKLFDAVLDGDLDGVKTYVQESLGANLDNFSFIRPQSIKGENNFEKLNRKHKTK